MSSIVKIVGKKQGKTFTFEGTMPESWEELSIGQYLDIKTVDVRDAGAVLEILTSIPRDVWYKAKASEVEEKMYGSLKWMETLAKLEGLVVPKRLSIGGVEYKLPSSLNENAWGQNYWLSLKMNEEVELAKEQGRKTDLSYCIPTALAIHMEPIVSGADEFNDKKVDDLEVLIRKTTPLFQAYAVGCFFLQKQLRSTKIGVSN